MTNAVAVSDSFQTKMFKLIQEQIGDLLTQEDLKALVDRTLNDSFFKERVVPDGNHRTKIVPSVFSELLAVMLKPMLREQVHVWMETNKEAVLAQVDQSLGKGMTRIVADYLDVKMANSMMQVREEFSSALNR
jgi:hypothetical protein